MAAELGLDRIRRRLGRMLGAAGTCLFSLTAFAATTLDADCPGTRVLDELEIATIAAPEVHLDAADRDTIDASGGARSEPVPNAATKSLPGITPNEILNELLADEEPSDDGVDDRPAELPPTATRLPGIADEDLPRFRRQMFRTDI